jgi:hypothetical protein
MFAQVLLPDLCSAKIAARTASIGDMIGGICSTAKYRRQDQPKRGAPHGARDFARAAKNQPRGNFCAGTARHERFTADEWIIALPGCLNYSAHQQTDVTAREMLDSAPRQNVDENLAQRMNESRCDAVQFRTGQARRGGGRQIPRCYPRGAVRQNPVCARQELFSGPRLGERRLSCREAQVDALKNAPVLFAIRAQLYRHGSLRPGALLGTRTQGDGA